jgi:hypothetical protein
MSTMIKAAPPQKELMIAIYQPPPQPYQPWAMKIAVIIDETTEASEVIKVDRVRISAMFMDEIRKIFQTNFVIGGLDSLGAFHINPAKQPALLAISQAQNPDWWTENMTGRTVFDYNEILRWIHESGAVNRAGVDIWAITNLFSYYHGEPLPAPTPGPPPPSEHVPGVIPEPPRQPEHPPMPEPPNPNA